MPSDWRLSAKVEQPSSVTVVPDPADKITSDLSYVPGAGSGKSFLLPRKMPLVTVTVAPLAGETVSRSAVIALTNAAVLVLFTCLLFRNCTSRKVAVPPLT